MKQRRLCVQGGEGFAVKQGRDRGQIGPLP